MEHYLDNAATTAVLPRAREAALSAMDQFGNPGSLHAMGQRARTLLEDSRGRVAAALGVKPGCVTFTSGGSESTNTALRGAAHRLRHLGRHIVSTAIEHDATLNTLKALQNQGFEVTLAAPERDGSVTAEAIRAALRPDTVLVSLMAVCNETGAVLPIREAKAAMAQVCPGALLHVDAVQAFCKIHLPMDCIDLMSLSAHKIGGLKGSGALYVREGLHLTPLIYGGNQENGLRSGTEAMPQIAAFGAACQAAREHLQENYERMAALRQLAIDELRRDIPELVVIGGGAPHILSISLPGWRSEVLMNYMEAQEIYVSKSSACKKGGRSHVLEAIGLAPKVIDGAIRIGLSRFTTQEDILALCAALKEARSKLAHA